MDDRDCLAFYPFVVVRIACRVCSRGGSYRLARLAAKFGPETSVRDLLDRFSYDCLWQAEARSKRGQSACGVYLPDLEQKRPRDKPPGTVTLASVGLDPYRGFFHAPRYGRPALALDLMEPFRAVIADSVVLSAVNTGEVGACDFVAAVTGTALTQAGRRRFVEAFERRLSQETTHPVFGYQVSMRRMLIVQARLLSRFLLGELPSYPHYLPR
jgi:CRISPR associated protein Cas1